nr:MAG TPA: hypothetical protein [Caudoviricetes sp.]
MSSIKDLKSMCANTPCRDCRLLSWCESRDRISELPDDMDEVVDAYVRNHYQKTYAMDFFEKFPNADREPDTDEPAVCRCRIYGGDCHNSDCTACWNMEMIEQ